MNKIFVGGVKEVHVQKGQYDFKYDSLRFSMDDLNLLGQHFNGGEFVNVKVMTSQKGNKYMEIDTFVPQSQLQADESKQVCEPIPASYPQAQQPVKQNDSGDESDIPF